MDNSYFTPTVEDLPGINARAIFVPDTTTLFKESIDTTNMCSHLQKKLYQFVEGGGEEVAANRLPLAAMGSSDTLFKKTLNYLVANIINGIFVRGCVIYSQQESGENTPLIINQLFKKKKKKT